MYDEDEVITFGNVNLDADEMMILKKRPEFAVFDTIKDDRINEEMLSTMTKIRWERWSHDDDDQGDEQDLTPEKLDEKETKEEMESQEEDQMRLVYNHDDKTINLGARRATDMRHNMRLIMPKPRSATEEAVLSTRMQV